MKPELPSAGLSAELIVKAWTDDEFFASLDQQTRDRIPRNPAGDTKLWTRPQSPGSDETATSGCTVTSGCTLSSGCVILEETVYAIAANG